MTLVNSFDASSSTGTWWNPDVASISQKYLALGSMCLDSWLEDSVRQYNFSSEIPNNSAFGWVWIFGTGKAFVFHRIGWSHWTNIPASIMLNNSDSKPWGRWKGTSYGRSWCAVGWCVASLSLSTCKLIGFTLNQSFFPSLSVKFVLCFSINLFCIACACLLGFFKCARDGL